MDSVKCCNEKYGFVILHYMAFEMTVECIDNLLNRFATYDMQIVVVDNASSNGSGKKLENKYNGITKVKVLLNDYNSGFAKGNNLGYRYLCEIFKPNYIIVMNNDVIIVQDDFLNLIKKIYIEDQFAVMGPDIYCPVANKHQNPAHVRGFTEKEIQQLYENICRFCEHPAFYYYKHTWFRWIKLKLMGNLIKDETIDRTQRMENVVLHGACYIFSKDYIAFREQCFFPETFLYMEEDILHFERTCDGLKILYAPELKIQHFEDVSTDASIKSGFAKFKMKNSEMKKSIDIMKRLIKDRHDKA